MDFQDAMAIGKANALRDRNRGGSTVRVFATTTAMFAAIHNSEADLAAIQARLHLEHARMDAYEAVAFELLGHTWEGLS